jgi:pimeloyl-ACP methyl ester carboxylesterase
MANEVLSRNIRVGNLDIHYLTGGHGDPMIVLHGGAMAWKENLAELADKYTIYIPDLPGFGRSQPIEGGFYIPEMVDFVDEFARELGLERFYLVGHSVGGGVALSYVLKFPHKIMKLVLISSMCLGKEISLWVRVLSRSALCRSVGMAVVSVFKGVRWVVMKLFAGIDFVLPITEASIALGSSMTTLREQSTVLVDQLSSVVVPTLVVWGANDPVVPASQAYTAAKLIPQCQVKVFEGCGHSAYHDRVPEFSELVMQFLG